MEKKKNSVLRIDINYAAEEITYFGGFCALGGFTTVYLAFKGLSNSEIGIASSVIAVITILLQLTVSNFCDRNSRIPLKKIISITYAVVVIFAACIHFIDMPVAMMMVAYIAANAGHKSLDGLLNSQMMQFNDAGIPAHFGWPRGLGSISYALASLILGHFMELYSPDILMPIFIVLGTCFIIFVLLMPVPEYVSKASAFKEEVPSFFQMLKGNKTLLLFLIAVILSSSGKTSCYTFLIRIIENLGGGTNDLGLAMFIQSGVELPMMLASVWILKRFLPKHIITVSFIFDTIKIIMISLAPSVTFIYIAMALSLLCFGLYGFSAVVFVNGIVTAKEKVRAQALMSLSSSIGAITSNIYAGIILDTLGLDVMLRISWILCISGVIFMVWCCHEHRKSFVA